MIKPGMIRLDPTPTGRSGRPPDDIPVGWCLPYAKPGGGRLTHRVRSGQTIVREGVTSHVALTCWCSALCFITENKKCATLTDLLPEGEEACALCELRATRAGKPTTKHTPIP